MSKQKIKQVEIKIFQIRIKEIKSSLVSDDMIVYVENPEAFTYTQFGNNKVKQTSGYNINVHEAVMFLYTNN
jgi:hypothetical protein